MIQAAALLRAPTPVPVRPVVGALRASDSIGRGGCANRGRLGEDEHHARQVTEALGKVQPKLTIGAPDDPLKKEADEVADKVMRMPAGVSTPPPPGPGFGGALDTGSGGAPLPAEARSFFEPRFARDLGHVRVHDGTQAGALARDIGARALTLGSHVYFASGHYDPASRAGRRLLAHELTHVLQQGRSENIVRAQADTTKRQGGGSAEIPAAKRSNKKFAREQGEADAAMIRAGDSLSPQDRALVNARLNFFQGAAKEAYVREVRPALIAATTKEIEFEPAYSGKVPDGPWAERTRIRRRRERTHRFFHRLRDSQLHEGYVKRLQLYLDGGMEANNHIDVEAIEQIIAERAPDAPWHASARADFLARQAAQLRSENRERFLPTLPAYWQNQFGALTEQTEAWPEEARHYARDLLWMWQEHAGSPAAAERSVFDDISKRFAGVVRDRARAIHKECQGLNRGTLDNVWGDPCEPWFKDGGRGKGPDYLLSFRRRLGLATDEDHVPYRTIVYWLEEFTKQSNSLPTQVGGVHLEILGSWAQVQGGMSMALKPSPIPAPGQALSSAKPPTTAMVKPVPRAVQSPGGTRPPPGGPPSSRLKKGDIVSPGAETGLGPQRVQAVLPGVEVLSPVVKMPRPGRALPPAKPATYAMTKAPQPAPKTAPQTPRKPARVPKDIHDSVERGIVEEGLVQPGPTAKPRPRSPSVRGAGQQARKQFKTVRPELARELGVRPKADVHHAIELQNLDRYPGIYTAKELNARANARGIPLESGGRKQLHNSKIREIIDRHYRRIDAEIIQHRLRPRTPSYNQFVRWNLDNMMKEIDYLLGQFFTENRRKLHQKALPGSSGPPAAGKAGSDRPAAQGSGGDQVEEPRP